MPDRENLIASLPAAPFPATHSLLSADALLMEVSRTYAIGSPLRCTLIRSYVNDVYAITTTADRYVLKVYRAGWRSWSEIAYEMDVLAHLAAKGVAVAPATARRDGRLIGAVRALEGLRYLVLFAYAAGEKPARPFTTTLYHHFGRATASLHRALDDFTSPHARIPLDLAYLLDAPLGVLRPHLDRRGDDWMFLLRMADKIRSRIRTDAAMGLDWGVCHGDLSLDNLHVTADQRIIFYDFDSGGPGWRACDLYGVSLCQSRENWPTFLDGYREVRPFGAADLAAIPYFVAVTGLWNMGHHLTNWARWSGQWRVTEEYFDRQIARWRQWDAEHLGDGGYG